MTRETVIVLAGNPNCGKTVLFNALTGAQQKVGNWPGVTVDKKTGHYTFQKQSYCVVDLPGTYSTSVVSREGSIDERIACQYLLSREADVIVNVIDGSNLERNLYLSLQLIEMQFPVILAVNMMDIVEKRGMRLDLKKLSARLGCPVVSLVASQKKGLDDLKAAVAAIRKRPKCSDFILPLTQSIQDSVRLIKESISEQSKPSIDPQWLAQRLLEGDIFAEDQVSPEIVTMAGRQCHNLEASEGEEPDILIADARYTLVNDIVLAVTQLIKPQHKTITQHIDRIVLHRFLGIPIFLLMMYLMFVFSINIGGAFQDFFDFGSTTLFVNGTAYLLTQWHAPIWLTAFVANGLGKGINTVVTFIPIIASMFLFLSFLEDSGYMARAAFVMDRFMQKAGLPGKAFVPMIVGFGCNVPAVMGARTLCNRRDRILTIMMMPFMSCGARLAIFAVFASAFFPVDGENIIFLLYVTGILAAILTGLLLRKTILPGKPAPLVMELPPYHIPRFGSLCRHMWQRLKRFITRAGKVILPVCVIIGVLNSVTVTGQLLHGPAGGQQSLLSEVGRRITPVLAPMGVEQKNWPATVGLVTGVLAKEVVVGTLNTLYSQQANLTRQEAQHFNLWNGLRMALLSIPNNLSGIGSALKNPLAASEARHDMNPAVYGVMYHRFDGKIGAFAYLLFILLYFPCVSTMAAIRRELNRRWAAFSVFWSMTFAYAVAVGVYQILTMMRHPVDSIIWLMVILAYFIARYLGNKYGDEELQKFGNTVNTKSGPATTATLTKEGGTIKFWEPHYPMDPSRGGTMKTLTYIVKGPNGENVRKEVKLNKAQVKALFAKFCQAGGYSPDSRLGRFANNLISTLSPFVLDINKGPYLTENEDSITFHGSYSQRKEFLELIKSSAKEAYKKEIDSDSEGAEFDVDKGSNPDAITGTPAVNTGSDPDAITGTPLYNR